MLATAFPGPVTEEAAEWSWGYEQAAVARAVLRGDGLADPFAQGSGPTAWCGAAYPVLLAGILRACGTTGGLVSFVTALVNAAFSAGTAIGLLRLGQALSRSQLGLIAAWVWVFHPGAVYFPLSYVWDSAILAFGITWFLVGVARRERSPTTRQAAALGAGLGALAWVNASVLALLPVSAAYWHGNGPAKSAARRYAIFVAAVAVTLSPWLLRNKIQLGTFKPKANLGVELMLGNGDEANGGFRPQLHPRFNLEELGAYRKLGEAEYDRRCRGVFLRWLVDNPGKFGKLTLLRMKNWWLGFSPFEPVPLLSGQYKARDWQGWVKWGTYFLDGLLGLLGLLICSDLRGGRILVGSALVCFPLVYYFVHVMERYRFPIEPLLVFLAVAFVMRLSAAVLSRLAVARENRASAPPQS